MIANLTSALRFAFLLVDKWWEEIVEPKPIGQPTVGRLRGQGPRQKQRKRTRR